MIIFKRLKERMSELYELKSKYKKAHIKREILSIVQIDIKENRILGYDYYTDLLLRLAFKYNRKKFWWMKAIIVDIEIKKLKEGEK